MGWVNSAYLVPLPDGLPVTTEEVAPCSGETPTALATGTPSSTTAPEYVYALESSYLSARCLRTVITFGTGPVPTGAWDRLTDEPAPANSLPADVHETMSGGSGVSVDLGNISSAYPAATDTDHGAYLVRQPDGALDLLSPIPTAGLRTNVRGLPERGVIVVDLWLDTERDAPPAGSNVVLTRQPFSGQGSIDVVGIAHPSDAGLSARIEDPAGHPVEAVYSGNTLLGTISTTEYAVQTSAEAEAWAAFATRAEGLTPGDYTLVLDLGSTSNDSEPLEVPFAVDQAGETPPLATTDELATVQALVDFARGSGSATSVPFADEVILGLNLVEERSLTAAELADPDAWVSDVQEFDGFVGPFSTLAMLAQSGPLRITTGPIPRCAGPPLDWPPAFDGLRQVNLEPIGISSCLGWFGVNLFLTPAGEARAVVLDLWGP